MKNKKIKIHPTAIIEGDVNIGEESIIGPYCVLSGKVRLGEKCILHSNVVITGDVIAGDENQFFPFACIGKEPQHMTQPQKRGVKIGNRNTFREYFSVHASTGDNPTEIGDNNYFMASSHIGHDCKVGNNNVFANYVGISGHCEVGDNNFFGGLSGTHQFVRIGFYCMIGGGSKIPKDVPPYVIVSGDRARVRGINIEGLKRAEFTSNDIKIVKKIYKIFFIEEKITKLAVERIEKEMGSNHLARKFIDFVKKTKRGITK